MKSKMPSITSITRLRVREVRRRCSLVQMRFRKRQGSRKRRPICRLKTRSWQGAYVSSDEVDAEGHGRATAPNRKRSPWNRQDPQRRQDCGTTRSTERIFAGADVTSRWASIAHRALPADGLASPTFCGTANFDSLDCVRAGGGQRLRRCTPARCRARARQ